MAMSKGKEDDAAVDAPVVDEAADAVVHAEVDGVVVATNRPDVPVAVSLSTGPGEHRP